MKRYILFLILCSFFAILCSNTKAQWEAAQVRRLTYDVLPNEILKLYIDENDKLYLFYLEGVRDTISGFVYDYKILYKTKEKGTAWSLPLEINTPTYIFGQNYKSGLWMDTKTGIIHLLYTNYSWSNLNYTNSTIPYWESVTIDSLIGQNAQYNSFEMSFDSLDNVHIAWHVDFDSIGTEWFRIIYANNSTGEWIKQQVSPTIFLGGMESGETFFDVQKNGTAHVVYYGGSWGKAYYAKNDSLNGNYWHIDTIPKPQRPLYYYGATTLKVDCSDRVHLITGGCIAQDCVGAGFQRHFYYYKQSSDSIWQGPEIILDSLFHFYGIYIDSNSVPYVTEWDPFTHCSFFTDRRLGFWLAPYQILDTFSMCNDLSSTFSRDFCFVLDTEGKGHGAFTGCEFRFIGQDDSLEIFYYGAPISSVEDTFEEQIGLNIKLFQNCPNPFNRNTIICYSLDVPHPVPTILKLYNILGKEVRELVNINQYSGSYRIIWDGKDDHGEGVSSGIYFYQLRAGKFTVTKKLVLIK